MPILVMESENLNNGLGKANALHLILRIEASRRQRNHQRVRPGFRHNENGGPARPS